MGVLCSAEDMGYPHGPCEYVEWLRGDRWDKEVVKRMVVATSDERELDLSWEGTRHDTARARYGEDLTLQDVNALDTEQVLTAQMCERLKQVLLECPTPPPIIKLNDCFLDAEGMLHLAQAVESLKGLTELHVSIWNERFSGDLFAAERRAGDDATARLVLAVASGPSCSTLKQLTLRGNGIGAQTAAALVSLLVEGDDAEQRAIEKIDVGGNNNTLSEEAKIMLSGAVKKIIHVFERPNSREMAINLA